MGTLWERPHWADTRLLNFQEEMARPKRFELLTPRFRSLVSDIEIIEVRYRKKLVGRGNARILKLTQLRLLPKDFHEQWLSQMD